MFFIIFSIIITTLSSQNIWELSSTIDNATHRTIKKFEVVDTNTIFFISTGGLPNFLFQSNDKGKTWKLVNDLTKYNVSSVRDIEVFDSVIYISFSKGVILKSTDYGNNFEKIDIGYNNFIHDLIMFDEKNGIANMPSSTLFKTHDSWESSTTISFPFFFNIRSPELYKDNIIYSIIFNFGDDKTSNPTYQFAKIDVINETIESKDIYRMTYNDLEIINDTVFYLCGKKDGITGGSGHDAVFKSTDSGKTWRTILDLYADWNKIPNINNHKKPTPFGLQDIAFKNDSVGIAVGQFGKILYTYDGGESWIYEQKLPREIDSLSPPTMLIAYAGDQAILGTYNGHVYTLKEDNLAPKPEDTLTISGKILTEDSLAKSNIPIRLNNNRITMTDEEGNYKFSKLSPGSYTVTALNKYFDGDNPSYYYEPFLYSPEHIFELTSDTSGIDFESELNYSSYFIFGYVLSDSVGVEGVKVNFDSLDGGSTYSTFTDKDGLYRFDSITAGYYKLIPKSENYKIEPLEIEIFLIQNHGYFNFEATPTSSVKENKNFEIRNNILISKEFAGMQYHIFSLTGRVVKSGILPKELNLNAEQTGTYILHITKGEQVIYTHKFQVIR